jgi:hypothetical protein
MTIPGGAHNKGRAVSALFRPPLEKRKKKGRKKGKEEDRKKGRKEGEGRKVKERRKDG